MMRHVSISTDPRVAAEQNGENARDANAAFSALLDAYAYTVEPYVATGSAASTIPLRAESKPPKGVIPIQVMNLDNPGASVSMPTFVANFIHDGLRGTLRAFEPDGLSSGVRYRLTFLVVR